MKKILTSAIALTFAVLSANAMACPKGTTLQGGTGPKHKGGKCVMVHKVQKKTPAKMPEKKMNNTPVPNKPKA
ncbi:hypothetical protein F975_01464 [Acinetobacter sp. ANC 3789]|uniref:hypothetical protein n=1 Tax=Acinetobacter sp. ANC 3789 TaxID=1217714 RepID=UPI0002D03298|nr:hypothetical protein F975_01464 [Acinetobacter sp. ANC 3789]